MTIVCVKLINLMLHVMYDEAQFVSESNSNSKKSKEPQETSNE